MTTMAKHKETSQVSGRVKIRQPGRLVWNGRTYEFQPWRATDYDRVYRGIPLAGPGWALSSATSCETAQRDACRAAENARPRAPLLNAR
jgi:hypothetical protein